MRRISRNSLLVRRLAMSEPGGSRCPLGVRASVVMDHETHAPTTLHDGDGLREVTVFPGPSEDFFSEDGYQVLKVAEVDNMVLPLDSTRMQEPLVIEIDIASVYGLHVALYALQNPTPENIAKALAKLVYSGDCEELAVIDEKRVDNELVLAPVPEPPGWDRG